jgi:hypothetical protein
MHRFAAEQGVHRYTVTPAKGLQFVDAGGALSFLDGH